MSDTNIIELLNRFLQGEITPKEKEILSNWIQEPENEAQLEILMEQAWQQFNPKQSLSVPKAEDVLQSILKRTRKQENSSAKRIKILYKKNIYRFAAVASIVLLLGVAVYFWVNSGTEPIRLTQQFLRQDIAPPQTLNAVLTLGNGKQIVLDSAINGLLAVEGLVSIKKSADGQITYRSEKSESVEEVVYNTLTIPKGSKTIGIELSDGTKVWINSASSLRYPNHFTGKERKVEIKGEAYFEVAKNENIPFIVDVNNKVEVKVLGTHFNVNAYEDESEIKTTLFEGSIKVLSLVTGSELLITPGEQATVDAQDKLNIEIVDLSETVAWKNGLFDFKDADIQTIIRQLARWYNLEVIYEKEITEKFYVKMSRDTNMSNVLKILEATGAVKFEIEGNLITII